MNAAQLLEVMSDVEARIAQIYERFATEFHDVADIGDLWVSMGREELHHAERLSLVIAQAPSVVAPAPAEEHLRQLQAMLDACEREVAQPVRLQEALRVTVDLEAAEAAHLHAVLGTLGAWAAQLAEAPDMQHRQRHLLEHAVGLFGTPAVQQRLAWQRFRDE